MKVARYAAVAAAMVLGTTMAQAQTLANCTGDAAAHAAGCVVSNTVSSAVPFVARMTLSSATTTLTAPQAADFGTTAGVLTPSALTLTVNANAAYKITAQAAQANFSGGSTNKPAGDLTYNVNGSSTYLTLDVASTLISTTAATAATVYTIGYKTLYNWTVDTPGTYTLPLNYTLTSP